MFLNYMFLVRFKPPNIEPTFPNLIKMFRNANNIFVTFKYNNIQIYLSTIFISRKIYLLLIWYYDENSVVQKVFS